MVAQIVNLNLTPETQKPVVNVSQYDTGARVLTFRLFNGRKPFTPPADAVAVLHGQKPDKTYFAYTCTIEDGAVIADCTEQMTPLPGMTTCEVRLTNDEGQIGSCNFILLVEKSPLAGAVISDTDIPEFEELAQAAAASASTAKASALESASSASDSAASATSAEESATSAANSATDAQTAAEQARESATASAGSAAQAQAAETGAEEFARNSATSAGESLAHMRDAQTAAGQAAASASAADTSAGNAAASASAADTSAGNAAASASAAAESATAADTSADRAEQAAKDAGYMYFYIDDNGDLIYQRTSNTQVDFYLSDGDLYLRGVA